MQPIEKYVTVKELARLAYGEASATTVKRVLRQIVSGALPATRKSGLGPRSPYLITRKTADKFIAAQDPTHPKMGR